MCFLVKHPSGDGDAVYQFVIKIAAEVLVFIKDCRTDEDIRHVDTTTAPTATHIQGPMTRARAKQLNYQVLSFLGTIPHIHENMMLPKSDMYLLLRNIGSSMD